MESVILFQGWAHVSSILFELDEVLMSKVNTVLRPAQGFPPISLSLV